MLALLAHGWRTWKHAPVIAILAIAALAIGVGATTAIYTFIQGVLLRPLPYANPDRYLEVQSTYRTLPGVVGSWSYPDCADYIRRNRTLSVMGCVSYENQNLSLARQAIHVSGLAATPALLRSLGIPLQQGSWFGDSAQDRYAAVISESLWRQVGSPAQPVGMRLMINAVSYTVKGVAPAWFHFPLGYKADVWIPLHPSHEDLAERGNNSLNCFAKMKPGITEAQASADMRRISNDLEHQYPDTERNRVAYVTLLLKTATENVRPTFLLLFAAATMLLLIACGNVASLLLARSVARMRETAVRVAIGATSWQLAVQYASEGLLIALAGAALGLPASILLVKLVLHFASSRIPRAEEIHVDTSVLLFTLAASVLCGLLFSMAPLWQALRTSPNAVLTNGSRATQSAGARRVLNVFVTAQIALSFALLAVSLICLQRLGILSHVDPGFDYQNVTIFDTFIPTAKYPTDATRSAYQSRLIAAVQAAGLARIVGFTTLLPFSRSYSDTIIVPDHRDVSHLRFDEAVRLYDYQDRVVSPGFFSALRMPLLSGRFLNDGDNNPLSPKIVISETVARRVWPHINAVGHVVTFGGVTQDATVVGVVGDVRDLVGKPSPGHIYIPYQVVWNSLFSMEWCLRTAPGAKIPISRIEQAIHSVDPEQAVFGFSTMEDRLQLSLLQDAIQSRVITFFGAAALLLAVLGVYGVVSYSVRQRIPEMGTRLALGATGNNLLYLVLRQSLLTALLGTAIGAVIVLSALPLLHKLDLEVNGSGPFFLSFALIALSTLLSALLPAWRASLLSPMIALRDAPDSLLNRARIGYSRVSKTITSLVVHNPSVTNSAEAALLAEIAESTRHADSFTTAIRNALTVLIERVPAQAAALLVRRKPDEPFRCINAVPDACSDWSLPFDSLLLTRLAHYQPAIPFTQGDLDVLNRWAYEEAKERVDEVNTLRSIGPFVAVAVELKSGISGVLFVTAKSGVQPFDGRALRLLRSVASQLALMIENSHLTDRIVEQERLRRELALASEVQKRLFPETPPEIRNAQLAGYCLPARGVGGDYYDFLRVGPDHLGLALADVAGKGIAAALVMSIVQASLRSLADDPATPLTVITSKVNRLLCGSTGPSSYATFFYAKFDENTRSLSYVNGGHNPPFVLRNHGSQQIEELTTGGMIIGMFPFSQYEEGNVQLEPNDVLMLFTDGVSEAHNPEEEEYGEVRLKDLLRRHGHLEVDAMSAAILEELQTWMADAPQHDDLTFVLMKVR